MVSPAAMNIESAVDMLPKVEQFWRDDQQKELASAIGANTATGLGVAFPLTEEFKRGYELGLATARVMIAGSAEVMLKSVNAENIL